MDILWILCFLSSAVLLSCLICSWCQLLDVDIPQGYILRFFFSLIHTLLQYNENTAFTSREYSQFPSFLEASDIFLIPKFCDVFISQAVFLSPKSPRHFSGGLTYLKRLPLVV